MTTIATNGRSMAGDTLVTAGGEHVGYFEKVQRTTDGRLFGASGLSADCKLFSKWMNGEVDRPDLSDDFAALVLTLDGKVFYLCRRLEPIECLAPMAIGSGADFALGAMLAGAEPTRAVEIACIRDTRSGGKITTLSHTDDNITALRRPA